MLKSNSHSTPTLVTGDVPPAADDASSSEIRAKEPPSLTRDEEPPAIFTSPFSPVTSRKGYPGQGETAARRAHRVRMKEYFTRTNPAQ